MPHPVEPAGPVVSARSLTRATRLELLDTLTCRLSASVGGPDDERFRGVLDVDVLLEATWSPEHVPSPDLRRLALVTAAAEAPDDAAATPPRLPRRTADLEAYCLRRWGDDATVQVGRAHLVVLDGWEEGILDALDGRGVDVESAAAVLGTHWDGLRARLGLTCRGLVLVNLATVHPAWRGSGVGLAGTGLALVALRRGLGAAVLFPMEPGTAGRQARATSQDRLSAYWARLGFRPWVDGYLALGLESPELDRSLARVRRLR